MDTTFLALAIVFMLVSIAVFVCQRRAKSCPIHKRRVGQIAVAIGVVCALASLALLVAACILTP
jgi:succinate-acetate transporter protein